MDQDITLETGELKVFRCLALRNSRLIISGIFLLSQVMSKTDHLWGLQKNLLVPLGVEKSQGCEK